MKSRKRSRPPLLRTLEKSVARLEANGLPAAPSERSVVSSGLVATSAGPCCLAVVPRFSKKLVELLLKAGRFSKALSIAGAACSRAANVGVVASAKRPTRSRLGPRRSRNGGERWGGRGSAPRWAGGACGH